jgi:hypothetical protein
VRCDDDEYRRDGALLSWLTRTAEAAPITEKTEHEAASAADPLALLTLGHLLLVPIASSPRQSPEALHLAGRAERTAFKT